MLRIRDTRVSRVVKVTRNSIRVKAVRNSIMVKRKVSPAHSSKLKRSTLADSNNPVHSAEAQQTALPTHQTTIAMANQRVNEQIEP